MAGPRASKSAVAKIREKYGLDDPVPVQYVNYVKGIFRGDLGTSFTTRRPVLDDLKRYLPATLELGLIAFIMSTLIGIPLGVISSGPSSSSLGDWGGSQTARASPLAPTPHPT
jgi:peptide/nickel transport system permease protein